MTDYINPLVYAIVLNWNGFDDTDKCIQSLLKSSYSNLKIIIVDNASQDNSPDLIANTYKNLPLIRSSVNGGYASGMNIGARKAIENNAEFIIFLNNDVIVSENFLEPLVKLAMSDNNIGIISPKVLYTHNSKIIYCAGAEVSLLKCGGICSYQGKLASVNAKEIKKISLAEGCLMFIRKIVFDKVGFMNEKYFMYFEDVDFAERVRNYFTIYYSPDSIIYHKSGAGHKWNNYSHIYNYYYTRNRYLSWSDKSIFYRAYVILYSSLISVAKSITILLLVPQKIKNRKRLLRSFKELWRGSFHGILLILNLKSLESINKSIKVLVTISEEN